MLSEVALGAIAIGFIPVAIILWKVRHIYYSIKMMKYGVEVDAEVTKVIPAKDFNGLLTVVYVRLMNAKGEYEEVRCHRYIPDYTKDTFNVTYLPENFDIIVYNEPYVETEILIEKGNYDINGIVRDILYVIIPMCFILFVIMPELLRLL